MLIPLFDNDTEELVSQLADELNISKKEVREAIEAPYKMFKEVVKSYNNNKISFLVTGLGTFKSKKIYVRPEKQPNSNKTGVSIDSTIQENMGTR